MSSDDHNEGGGDRPATPEPAAPAPAKAPQPAAKAPQSAAKAPLWRRLLPLVLLGAGLTAFFLSPAREYLNLDALRANQAALESWVAENAVLAALAFVGFYILVAAFSLPLASVLTIAGGFLFGTVWGTVFVVVGATIGATLLFLAARTALGDGLRARAGPFVKRMEKGFNENAFSYLMVLRLVPLFPFWLVNLVPAFLGVRLATFFTATLIGIIPGSFVYVSVGNGLRELAADESPDLGVIFKPEILIPIVGLAVLALVPVIYGKFFAGKKKEPADQG